MQKLRVVYMGSGEVGIPALRALISHPTITLQAVVTQPDKRAGRGLVLTPPAVKCVALEAGLAIYQPASLKGSGGQLLLESLQASRCDVVVVFAYGKILPDTFLNLPSLACINIHTSLLPRHRGASPIHAAILAGDRESGVSVVHMTSALDAGDVILERRIPLHKRETAGSLHDKLASLAVEPLLQSLEALASGVANRIPQDENQATYAPKLDRHMGRIDWSQDGVALDRLIRGLAPWPGAWTELLLKNKRLRVKILKASPICSGQLDKPPGSLLRVTQHGLLVAAGRGALLLREVQAEGRKRMTGTEFARGLQQLGEAAFL